MNANSIYVDLDDVLCQAARHFLVIVEREFNKRVEYSQLIHFDVGRSCQLAPEQTELLYQIVHRPDELLRMAPIDEAIAALRQWADQGFEIAIVTGRPPESREVSLAWLERHGVPFHSFTVVDKYGRFAAGTDAISLEQLARRRYSWAVEDSLPMARFLGAEMRLPVALVDRPWNRADPAPANVDRFSDWPALAERMPRLRRD